MQSPPERRQAPPGRQCKARNKRGEPCAATVVGAGGYCVVHDPEAKVDMRELGRKGGKANGKPNPERVPTSLREELQKLDPAVVRGALEQALAGGNESARVSAVKLLADVDAFRQDGECLRCAEAAAEAVGARERLIAILVGRAERRETQGSDLVGERDQAILERDQALARLAEFTAGA